jgi:hypothetical protein
VNKKPVQFETAPKELAYGEMHESPSNRLGWTFGMTLRLGEYQFQYKGGIFQGFQKKSLGVSLTAANLIFDLKDCILPDEDWEHDPTLEVERKVERTATKSTGIESVAAKNSETTSGMKSELSKETASLGAEVSSHEKNDLSARNYSSLGIEDKLTRKVTYISASGGPAAPQWTLTKPDDEIFLRGTIKSRRWARAEITGKNPRIDVYLQIPPHALHIRDEDGSTSIGINKKRIAHLKIRQALCQKTFLLCSFKPPVKP